MFSEIDVHACLVYHPSELWWGCCHKWITIPIVHYCDCSNFYLTGPEDIWPGDTVSFSFEEFGYQCEYAVDSFDFIDVYPPHAVTAIPGPFCGSMCGQLNLDPFFYGHVTVVTALNYTTGEESQTCVEVTDLDVCKIRVEEIVFNYDSENSLNDSINLRKDYYVPIDVPEYVKGTQNQPAAYLKEQNVRIQVRLTMNPAVDGTYGIRGISDDNGVLGNTGEVWVTFEGGISQEGPDDPNTPFDDSEFVEFLILGQTPGMISKSEESWRWEMNTGGEWVEFDTTSGHEIYVLWDYPQPPWVPNGYYDHKTPWVKALDFAIHTAGACNMNDVNAIAQITDYLFSSHGLIYDKEWGRERYGFKNTSGNMDLHGYIDKLNSNVVNCYDQAGAICALGCLLGVNVDYRYMSPFGYINTIEIVGIGSSNNPLFENPGNTGGIVTGENDIWPIRFPFGNHAFTNYQGYIYDATAGANVGSRSESQYVMDTIDRTPAPEATAAGNVSNIQQGTVTDLMCPP